MGIEVGKVADVAQNLAIACLNHKDLAELVLGEFPPFPAGVKPKLLGERLGQFYAGIYKAVDKV